jgi:hypothetical protein
MRLSTCAFTAPGGSMRTLRARRVAALGQAGSGMAGRGCVVYAYLRNDAFGYAIENDRALRGLPGE